MLAMKSSRCVLLSLALVVLARNFPAIAIKAFLITDWAFPSLDVRSSMLYNAYFSTVTYFLTAKPVKPVVEINFEGNATKWDTIREDLRIASNNYRNPVVLRKAGPQVPELQREDYWIKEYGSEEVLCHQVYVSKEEVNITDPSEVYCTIEEFFKKKKETRSDSLYVSGATSIFSRRPELQRLVKTASGDHNILDTEARAHQLFMGFGGDGSETHGAMASNIFYQVAGRKSWMFFPPSQTPYLKAQMNAAPYAHITDTVAQTVKKGISPWVSKLDRYQAILEPGDMLFNPSWWWHSVYNLGGPDDLVAGCPVRYTQPKSSLANSPFFTLFLGAWIKLSPAAEHLKTFQDVDEDGRVGFEKQLASQRADRLM